MDNHEGMRFPHKETKSRTYCCVHTCNSRASRDPTVRFHYFPPPESSFVDIVNEFGGIEKVDRRKAWEIALKMNKEVTPSMRVCSLHFTRDNYILPDFSAMSRYLKTNAVPSCNLPRSPNTAELRNNRDRQLKRLKQTRQHNVTPKNRQRIAIAKEVDTSVRAKSLLPIHAGTQTINRIANLSSYFCATNAGNDDLSALTGISNFSMLDDIVKIVLKVAPQFENYCQLSIRHRVILTFLKLKHNVSYSVLAVIFNSTGNNCKKAISQMVDILSSFLKYAIPWPSKAEILRNMPLRFKDYGDVRVVIDSVQVFIQRPKKLCSRVNTYSRCKGENSVKFMIGVTPSGIISFTSKTYSGRVTNSVIFEQSGLIDLLEKKDAVMIGGDFLIDDICREADVRPVRAPFNSNNKQLSKDETLFVAECLNQSLKAFRVLGDRMSVDFANKSDQIITIVCAMLNLSSGVSIDVDFPS